LKWNSPQARHRKNSFLPGLLLICCLGVLFFSCGIEEEIYLEPIASTYQESITRGSLTLPDNSSSNYFRYYMIYYRIYLSDQLRTAMEYDSSFLGAINSNLSSHFTSINNSYIANENASTSGLGSSFSSLRYYPLFVSSNGNDSIAMYNLLSPQMHGNPGSLISFNFLPPDNLAPRLEINNTTFYYLFRNADDFTPDPDRLFALSEELLAPPTTEVNLDVHPKSGVTSSYAYVSLYICAVGINNTFAPVYSRPTHIGIFQLPE